MDKEASRLERDHVHSVYEKIAPYFNDTRYKAWPRVRQFLLDQEPGSIIADIGCGNGKYLHINSETFKLGCDCCRPLVEAARSHGHEVQVCNGLRLPYRDGCFDAVLSIAVIHHFSTKERRIRAIKEMARTLRVGGRVMIYVWAMEQKRRRFEKQDIFVPWNPHPPSSPATRGYPGKARQDRRGSSTGDCASYGTDGSDKHRKTKSTSSVAGEEETASTSHGKSKKLWFFSRSLDSVLDFGGAANSRSTRELSTSCDDSTQMKEANETKVFGLNRGMGLIKQVSSFFSSRHSSDEDVFGSVVDQDPPKLSRVERNGNSATEQQGLSAAIVHTCGAVPLPDLVTHQNIAVADKEACDRAYSNRLPSGEQEGRPEREVPQFFNSTEGTQDKEMNKQNKIKSADSFLRYYHVFKEGELLELIERHVEELHVLQSYFDHANWCVIAEKVQVWQI
ncbi:TRM9B methyltransferase, partial [Atractosteus spatula]|nr:TRM9B methyltransferase [Atractosteus spatula]